MKALGGDPGAGKGDPQSGLIGVQRRGTDLGFQSLAQAHVSRMLNPVFGQELYRGQTQSESGLGSLGGHSCSAAV